MPSAGLRREGNGDSSVLGLVAVYAVLSVLSITGARLFTDIEHLGVAEAAAALLILRQGVPTRVTWLQVVPLLAVVALAVHAIAGPSLPIAAGRALADTVEIALSVELLRRLHATVLRRWMVAALLVPVFVIAFIVGPIAAAVMAGAAAWSGAALPTQAFVNWWLGHAIGAFVVVPVMVAWAMERDDRGRPTPNAMVGQIALGALAIFAVVASAFVVKFPFIAIGSVLLTVAVTGRLLTNAVVSTVSLAWLAVLPTFVVLQPGAVAGTLLFYGLGLGERLVYAGLAVLPPLAIAAINLDLQRAHRHLAVERQRLHAIADNVPALIAHLDNQLRYRFVNQRHRTWWGLSAAQVLGRRPDEVLPPEVACRVMPLLHECLQGRTCESEMPIDDRVIHATYVTARDVAGLNGVLVLASDITEYKRLQQQLRKEKEFAQITLSSIGDAVVTVDADLAVTYLNPVAEEKIGRRLVDVRGRRIDEVLVLRDAADATTRSNPLEAAVREDRIVGLSDDVSLVSADGREYAIQDSAAPIHDDEGRVVGAVMVFHDVSESRALSLRMAHLAQHDALTGLPNRVLLQDRLERALADHRGPQLGALMFLDLDRFKHINDSLGHPVGDGVLKDVARRFQDCVREVDTLSRQGGDEFVVLLPRLRNARDAARVAEKLMHALEDPIEVDGHLLHVAVTIGIALFPADGHDAESVVRHADIALYQAKSEGRGRYRFYDRDMSHRAELRLHVENELRGALRAGQFELVLQPKYDASGRSIVSAEALLRWRRGDRLEPPSEFLRIAEDSGLIPGIETWALRRACAMAAGWERDGLGGIPIAVNTAFALHRPQGFIDAVRDALDDAGLPPERLVLEIVERQLAFDPDGNVDALHELAADGVRISVDDFGTEYSNLHYLQRFPFHELKIDRSFTGSVDDGERGRAVVAAIIAVARALDIQVVAEGVETSAQHEALVELGCEHMQGYLFAPPMSEARFRALLEAQTTH